MSKPSIVINYEAARDNSDTSVVVCLENHESHHKMTVGKFGKAADEIYDIVSNQTGLEKHDAQIKLDIIQECINIVKEYPTAYFYRIVMDKLDQMKLKYLEEDTHEDI